MFRFGKRGIQPGSIFSITSPYREQTPTHHHQHTLEIGCSLACLFAFCKSNVSPKKKRQSCFQSKRLRRPGESSKLGGSTSKVDEVTGRLHQNSKKGNGRPSRRPLGFGAPGRALHPEARHQHDEQPPGSPNSRPSGLRGFRRFARNMDLQVPGHETRPNPPSTKPKPS